MKFLFLIEAFLSVPTSIFNFKQINVTVKALPCISRGVAEQGFLSLI